ncbi:HAD-IA family hydrolase [Paenarthrobacter sp. YJN-5]|uniref:HAD-IA family hydrolase n=1 Tax=Paenarthrobacter sp. YJN-5 TaxID=2735316 RepID=UPI0018777966|nr:HAD-IA family hydrolase [Paenarthrobacter sp. YJN-5]QOT15253.1 HAD-IA family hydrolase [Paenarthrobacter sp. YJN-5]
MPSTHAAAPHGVDALRELTFDAVLFDLDGTLVDSTPAVVRSWLTWAAEENLDPEFRERMHGMPAPEIVLALVGEERFSDSLQRVLDLEHRDTHDIVPLPGAQTLLSSIPAGKAAIATSCTASLADVRIKAAGLQAPRLVVSYDDVSAGKPAPEPFLKAAEGLGVDPARCLVVEDAPAGIAAARAAGCRVLAVTGTHAADDLRADAVVDSLEGLEFRSVDGALTLVTTQSLEPRPASA